MLQLKVQRIIFTYCFCYPSYNGCLYPSWFYGTGTAGEFLYTIPMVVSIALIVSVLVAIFLVPYLNYVFIKKGLKITNSKKKGKSFLNKLQGWFDASLEKAFKYPKTVMSVGIAAIVIAIVLFKTIPQQLFPEMERNQFAVEVYLPIGSSIESTAKIVDSLENVLLKDKCVTNVTSFIGTSSPRFHTVYAPNMPATNYGQLLVNTVSNEATRKVVNKYSPKYSESFANAHVKWKILALQPTPSPIEIRISSDSIKDIRLAESEINQILKKTQHLAWIRNDWDQKQQSIRVNLDRDKANRMGYSKGLVSTSIMVGLTGLPLTTIWENDYPVEVTLSQESNGYKNIKTLEDQYITSPNSFSANPLRSFASFSPEWTEGTIVRRNGTRTLTIKIDNDSKGIASSIFDEIRPQIEKLKLPAGTNISYGGEFEAQGEVFVPMGIALGLSIVIIFFILLFQFKKVKLSLLIMSTMLLALPGAAIGLSLMGYSFSVTAFVGITSLCGMVVRNGIILVDYALKLKGRNSMHVKEAALKAGKRRMRPIFLTSAAAAVGVIPMIISRSPLWGPLGTVICFGLLISMVLTLYILPILFSWMYKDKPKKSRTRTIYPKAITTVVILTLSLFSIKSEAQTLSLDSCKVIALQNNVQIKNGNLEIDASKQVKKGAFTKYFPSISATGMKFKFKDPLIKFDMPSFNLPVYNGNPATLPLATEFAYFPGLSLSMLDKMTTGSIMATQPIFAGGRILYGNKLANLGLHVSEQKLTMSKNEVLLKTEEQYWLIVSLNEKMRTIDTYSLLLDTLYKDVNNAYKAGLISHSDVFKVTIKQSELSINKLKLENGKKLATMAFCQYIGIVYDSLLVLPDSAVNYTDPIRLFVNPQQALSNRVEYQLMQESIKAEKLQTKMKRGEYLPEIAIGVGAFAYNMSEEWSNNSMAFGSVSIPISNWWEASHTLKERKIKEQIAQNSADNTSELLILQMQKAWNDLQEAFQQILLARDVIKQAEENLKINYDNYKSGVVNIADLLEAQAILQQTKDGYTDACTNYMLKSTTYQQVTGNYK